MMMPKITETLNRLRLGEAQTHQNMTLYPLHGANGHPRGYLTLEEALEQGQFQVTEVSEGGSVPVLAVQNQGELPVLLVVGEELVGSKQNRVLNTSLLVPAQATTQIPVSCVEQGRWRYTSRTFSASPTTAHLKLRRMSVHNVTASLNTDRQFDAKQGEVWGEVSRKMASHAAYSNTGALRDVYEQTETSLRHYVEAFQAPASEGMLVVINQMVVGVDLFDHAETLQRLFGKLLRGYALDALEQAGATPGEVAPEVATPQHFLAVIQQAQEERYPSAGVGEDVRLTHPHLTGSALLWEGRAVHVSVFNAQA
ncbi:MAG: hypothetical protein HC915_14510 [Anaerolineae bacterium]|nr:hypothetical protein [Anaerolineae bacterium]